MHTKTYLTLKDVLRRYSISQATIYRWLNNGDFPQGIRIGATRRWNIEELIEFEQEKTAGQ